MAPKSSSCFLTSAIAEFNCSTLCSSCSLFSVLIPDDVSKEEKQDRKHLLEDIQQTINSKINETYNGNQYEVLVEGHERGHWKGRTRTDKIVFFDSTAELLGQLVTVNIQSTGPWSLKGSLVQN